MDGAFLLTDISSIVVANSGGWGHAHESWNPDYETNYMNVSAYSDLELLGNTYLRSEFQHDLLLSPETTNFTPDFKSPFFYTGDVRTYFVRPVDISCSNMFASRIGFARSSLYGSMMGCSSREMILRLAPLRCRA